MLIPAIAGDYVTVYRPGGDRYPGPDTPGLEAGQWYDRWVPNDHGFAVGPDGRRHVFGITHPLTSPERVHDGEYQSFHAMAPPGRLSEVIRDGTWADLPKVLTAPERPGEPPEQHSPCIARLETTYHMFYGPNHMRLATSADLMSWTPRGTVFEAGGSARDPSLLQIDSTYLMTYCIDDRVEARTTQDLWNWSEPRTVLRMPTGIAPESPCLIAHNGTFYLFVCGWDGDWDGTSVQGAYQHQTWVYQSDDPARFAREVATLQAHAPEVIRSEDGRWYISSAEWPQRGVSLAELVWR